MKFEILLELGEADYSSSFTVMPLLFECDQFVLCFKVFIFLDDTMIFKFLHNLNIVSFTNFFAILCVLWVSIKSFNFFILLFLLISFVMENLGRIHIYFSWSGRERVLIFASFVYLQKLLITSYAKGLR